ncbi:MAG: SDR family oxidoreductase [Chloroflexi bacterium]|nr:SDR family oxidoreductase [Chloroflexota bacterium]
MSNLKKKVVLITGASSGFGEDAALLFAKEGCKVALSARRMDRLQELAAKIQSAGGEAFAIQADITILADVENMVKSTLEHYGQIDILYNNAGIGRVDWFENHSLERDIDMIIRLNLTALMQVTRLVLPHMLKRRKGHIINMSSVAGLIASPLLASYSASKFGARAFTDVLRREVAPFGIKVSGIYPGPATTEFGQHIGKSETYGSVRKTFDMHMTSAYVARRVLDVAKRPRRSLVIPWWYRVLAAIEALFPVFSDWVLFAFSKINHKLD